jgi:hypothetical protein
MTEDLLDYWIRIIRPLFPENAWVAASLSKGDYVILIDWRRKDNPSKRSRKIEIIIKEEAIDRYLEKDKAERVLSDLRLKDWLCARLKEFDPDQDSSPTGLLVKTEKWRISKDVISSGT